MALMLSKINDALLAAGAPEEKARDAAEEIAACKYPPTRIESDIALIEAEIAEIRNAMATKTWLMRVMLVRTIAILGGVAGLLKLLH